MSQSSIAGHSQRLQSIDALRGFDMFWIMGGDVLARSLTNCFGLSSLSDQFEHVEWHGFRFYDLIFPLFLFLVGAVLPFSLGKYSNVSSTFNPAMRRSVHWRITKRTFLLIALGLVCSGILQLDFTDFRWPGVLQRIGICYFFAAMAFLQLNSARRILLFIGILVGYWCLLLCFAAPGFPSYDLTKEGSLPGYLDRLLIPGKLYYGAGDNEGLLSTIPAIATTLLGVFAGEWLQSKRTAFAKTLGLLIAGTSCLVVGSIWSVWFPLNKILWTSSFVLVSGGWSLVLLAIFFQLIDGYGYRRWAFPFVVIGMNAITIYVMSEFVDFESIGKFFLGGLIHHVRAIGI